MVHGKTRPPGIGAADARRGSVVPDLVGHWIRQVEGAAFAEHVGDDYRDGVRRVCRGVVQRRATAIVVRDVIEQYARVIIASIAFSFVRSFVRFCERLLSWWGYTEWVRRYISG